VFGDVGAPTPVRSGGDEPALYQVLVHGRLRSVAPLVPVRDPAPADQPHQPGHPFTADPDPHPEAQLGVHPRRAVGAARHRVHVDDGVGQVGVLKVTPGTVARPATRSTPT